MPQRRWSRDKILEELHSRAARGLPLTVSRVRKEVDLLYAAALYYFGSWRTALRAARLKIPSGYRHLWTREEMIAALRSVQRTHGNTRARTLDAIARRNGSGIVHSIDYHFGSLRAARRAAGVPIVQGWTRDKIIAALRRESRNGVFRYGSVRAKFSGLVRATETHFGSWRQAIRAAGLQATWPHNHFGRYMQWTKETVRQILRQAARKGPVTIDPLRKKYAGIYKAACRQYGSWWKALDAAGVRYR